MAGTLNFRWREGTYSPDRQRQRVKVDKTGHLSQAVGGCGEAMEGSFVMKPLHLYYSWLGPDEVFN